MAKASYQEITQLLQALSRGRHQAAHQLMPLVYEELHRLAHRQLQKGRPGATLNTTGLVHEAYLKLVNGSKVTLNDRTHFFRLAAKAMRQILVDQARKKQRLKRGGDQQKQPLNEVDLVADDRIEEILALDQALSRLAELDPRQHQIVELRYFAGFTIQETGHALGLSPATIKREWNTARAWLLKNLQG